MVGEVLGPDPGGRKTVNYVPAEVCILLAAGGAGKPLPSYEQARAWLNPKVTSLTSTPPSGLHPDDGIEADDLNIVSLARAVPSRDVLQPLMRAGQPAQDSRQFAPSPTIRLDRADAAASALHFFRIDAAERQSKAPGDRNDQNVRDLVNLINWDVLQAPARWVHGDGWHVIAATPNWHSAGTGENHTGGGPGARPEPGPQSGTWTCVFPTVGVASWLDKPEASVLVAVLDTCPQWDDFVDAGLRYRQNNPFWDVVFQQATATTPPTSFNVDQWPSITREQLDRHLTDQASGDPFLANSKGELAGSTSASDPRHFRMPDHGLFAAGLIRGIAPEAEIHILRVLNDYGVGDLWALTNVLAELPELRRRRKKDRLIANLSLVADVPPGERLVPLLLPRTAMRHQPALQQSQDLRLTLSGFPKLLSLLSASHRSLAELADWLDEQSNHILVVAAAGNDHEPGDSLPPEPRYPAHYDNVFAVAAVNRGRSPAGYSNRGDVQVMGNGVATFGGDAQLTGSGEPARIQTQGLTPGAPVDAVVGLFSAQTFPMFGDGPASGAAPDSGPANQSGWAYWAGTSFATPIISGNLSPI